MEAFWGITLSILLLRAAFKGEWLRRESTTRIVAKDDRFERLNDLANAKPVPVTKSAEERRREKEVEELRKQGYDDELIAVIIPTINNGQ